MALDAGVMSVCIEFAQGLKDCDWFGRQDPYCIVRVGGQTFRTRTALDAGRNPVWNETFRFNCINENTVDLEVKDEDISPDDHIGSASVSLARAREYGSDRLQVPVLSRRSRKQHGFISVSLTWQPNSALRPQQPAYGGHSYAYQPQPQPYYASPQPAAPTYHVPPQQPMPIYAAAPVPTYTLPHQTPAYSSAPPRPLYAAPPAHAYASPPTTYAPSPPGFSGVPVASAPPYAPAAPPAPYYPAVLQYDLVPSTPPSYPAPAPSPPPPASHYYPPPPAPYTPVAMPSYPPAHAPGGQYHYYRAVEAA